MFYNKLAKKHEIIASIIQCGYFMELYTYHYHYNIVYFLISSSLLSINEVSGIILHTLAHLILTVDLTSRH